MKKILFLIAMLFTLTSATFANEVNDSTYTREGNNFTTTSKKSGGKYKVTNFTFTDSKGNKYPILINTSTGHCKVMKTSQKTGKEYAYYLSEELSETIAKEEGIKYIPTVHKNN